MRVSTVSPAMAVVVNLDCLHRLACAHTWVIEVLKESHWDLRFSIYCALQKPLVLVLRTADAYDRLLSRWGAWLIIFYLHAVHPRSVWNPTVASILNPSQLHLLNSRHSMLAWNGGVIHSDENVLLINSRRAHIISLLLDSCLLFLLLACVLLFIMKESKQVISCEMLDWIIRLLAFRDALCKLLLVTTTLAMPTFFITKD